MHFFIPCATLTQTLQDADLSMTDAFEAVMKISRSIEQLKYGYFPYSEKSYVMSAGLLPTESLGDYFLLLVESVL